MGDAAPRAGVSDRWQVWVDTGGTFTDCLAIPPGGPAGAAPGDAMRRVKVLSSAALRAAVAAPPRGRRLPLEAAWGELPEGFLAGFRLRRLGAGGDGVAVEGWDAERREAVLAEAVDAAEPGTGVELLSPEEAPVLAARLATGTAPGGSLPPMALRLATTRGTNALLERGGEPPALFVTRGFGDLLAIGTQQRPDLFALEIVRPEPLYGAVVEVDERLAADGTVVEELDAGAVAEAARRLSDEGFRGAAVALLHSYRQPRHEEEVAAILAAEGFEHVSRSSDLAPLVRVLPRAETAVVDAYLAPVVGGYLARVGRALGEGSSLLVMTSAGGLAAADGYRAKDSLLSGPAGGVVGAARAGRRSWYRRLVAFDMGGTSTDVSRYDGDHEYRFETRIGGARLVAPSLAIETVAAGGGSICAYADGRLRVGPRSAGADPGPACYGAGGPLTVTDVNLLLGRLWAERFEIPLAPEAAEEAAEALLAEVAADGGAGEREEVLAGLLRIADERMADAIRSISVRRGYDPGEHALVAFGGAGGQHACAVAGLLGIDRVVVPADAALLSALGLGHAVIERFAQRQVLRPLAEVEGELPARVEELAAEARRAVGEEGFRRGEIEVRRRLLELRLVGQESTVRVEVGEDPGDLEAAFGEAYEAIYGYPPPARREIEVESVRVVASVRRDEEPAPGEVKPTGAPDAVARRRLHDGGRWVEAPIWDRAGLPPGAGVAGPALVCERHSTAVVAAGWGARVDGAGNLVLARDGGER